MSEVEETGATSRARRPSVEKTAQTRRAIVAAALDAFLERGFSATRMIDVASRAGLAKGTLYLYFPDKDTLFEGVLRDVMTEPLASLRAAEPEPHETTRAFLARTLLPVLREMETSRRGPVIRLIVTEGARFPALAAMYRRLVIAPAAAAISRLAQRAVERGELASDGLRRFPQILPAPLVLGAIWNGLYGAEEPLDLEAMFVAFLDLIFGPEGA